MSTIDDLVRRIEDGELREKIRKEVQKLEKRKKFGLVYEDHLPEYTILYGHPILPGRFAARAAGPFNELYKVLKIENGKASCLKRRGDKISEIDLAELVAAAEFGDPIYPCLEPVDRIEHDPESALWHTLIEADNYHALQLMNYLYPGKVDCIYIDPPYNSGARDWKYNNDYVDANDAYRHSKWLSMMEKRLKLAKKLLNPENSVMIVTIDEKEYLHLGCLLEQLFPEAKIQMISSAINPKGSIRDGFSRSDEYIYFVMFGSSHPLRVPLSNEWSASAIVSAQEKSDTSRANAQPGWTSMMRRGTDSKRQDSPNLYYPIYVDENTKTIKEIGMAIPAGQDRAPEISGLVQVLPLRRNGEQGRWQVGYEELKNRIKQGRIRVGKPTPYGFVINYLPDGEYAKIERGEFKITGYAPDGSLLARKETVSSDVLRLPPTQWRIASHNASENGSTLLSSILGEKRFSFPKSLYAVRDALRFFVADKPDALILDFFAGSGTTLHAVNLLNAEDGGKRRCIMVTNNEVSADEAKKLAKQGYRPGDAEWEKWGIARHVAWPRTICSISGRDVKGDPLKGEYKDLDRPMADGLAANAEFFKLAFLDKTAIALGRQLAKLLPLLWLKAGSAGPLPELDENAQYHIYPQNGFAILPDQKYFLPFREELEKRPEIRTAYLITDSEREFQSMAAGLPNLRTYQLYKDYLENFRINQGEAR